MNPFREWFVQELKKRGISVQAFGSGWPNGRITYQEMNDIFRQSRINLNISNSRNFDFRFATSSWKNFKSFRKTPKNKEQMKGRHFEIPAFGGFQLSNYVEFLEDYFAIGKEITIYNTIDDLVDKIRYYLKNENLRRAITQSGYQRTTTQHLYKHRFQQLWNSIQEQQERNATTTFIELHDQLFPQAVPVTYKSKKRLGTQIAFQRNASENIAVFTDRNLDDVKTSLAQHKVAWLVESRDLHEEIYQRMLQPNLYNQFDNIFTYDQRLGQNTKKDA